MVYDYEYFKKQVLALTKIDLNCYKEKQMKRRIDTLINRHEIVGYDAFVERIKKDPAMMEEFVNYLTINVSEFYRNPDQWVILDKQILPELISRFGNSLTVWSAACSTGDEPYSLVMALSRHVPLSRIRIIATDIDKQVLATAKNGVYSEKSVANVPADLKQKFFTRVGTLYRISDDVKRCVDFREHNLLRDDYPKNVDLIVCRNVLIYFTEEAKDGIFKKFYNALSPGGVLFLGNTEQMMGYKDVGYERKTSFYFEKPVM
ncbi:MAG: protein-glutamate O-methyltransferase CheR [Lachnospiraceae bacterium]|nr:protein-glutamate O-methyltransferase CheR [Lachnospiraceae bacterium]